MISLKINGIDTSILQVKFSDGAKGFTLSGTTPVNPNEASLLVKPEGSLPEMFFEIAQAVDVLRQLNNRIYIHLLMPYIPYARQDRPMVRNDAFSLRVFSDLLNKLKLDKVTVVDAHSDVSCALINNVTHVQQHQLLGFSWVQHVLPFGDVLVSPDAGSLKKIEKVAEVMHPSGRVTMAKVRDVRTGQITGCRISDCDLSSLEDRSCLIVDDICDGGATFIGIAQALKSAGVKHINLWVTHGIFSRGLDSLYEAGIDRIFTTTSIPQDKITDVDQRGRFVAFPIETLVGLNGVFSGVRR